MEESILAAWLAPHFLEPQTADNPWPDGEQSQDAERIRRECADVQQFAEHFLKHLCRDEWSQMHLDFFEEYRQDQGKRGHRRATAAPRGNAKTTVRLLAKTLHEICYQTERFIVIVSSRAEMAQEKVKMIREELDSNEALRRIYGIRKGEKWNNDDIITSNGVRVLAVSRHMQVRGLLWRGHRVTKICFDDSEHSEEVLTMAQRDKFDRWASQDILKLGDGDTNVDVIGTILHQDAWLARLLANPGYHAKRYAAVIRFATNLPLWQRWRQIVIDLDNPQRLDEAMAFYAEHEAAMLEGTEVLWPQHEPYVQLMLERITDGDLAFYCEKQNQILGDSRRLFDMENAAYVRKEPMGLRKSDGRLVHWQDLGERVAYFDPTTGRNPTARHDYASCVVLTQDRSGYLYALEAYHEQRDKTSVQIAHIVEMLWRWEVQTLGVEANGFQSLLLQDIQEAIAQRALEEGRPWGVNILPVTNMRNKILRINTLEPLVANGWLQFADDLPATALVQLAEYIPIKDATVDDFPDALEGAVRVIKRHI